MSYPALALSNCPALVVDGIPKPGQSLKGPNLAGVTAAAPDGPAVDGVPVGCPVVGPIAGPVCCGVGFAGCGSVGCPAGCAEGTPPVAPCPDDDPDFPPFSSTSL